MKGLFTSYPLHGQVNPTLPTRLAAHLSCGTPHLMPPQGAGQFMNAQACVAAGAALAVEAGELSTKAATEGARRLLDDPCFAESAAAIGAEIRAMPGAEHARDMLLDHIDSAAYTGRA